MIVTAFTRSTLKFRRQRLDLEKRGYRLHETDWEIVRGGRYMEVIVDAIISANGKGVYTKIGAPVKLNKGREGERG